MSRANRNRKPARRRAFKDANPVILVVAEGEVTEKDYLEGFKQFQKNPRVNFRFVGGAGDPLAIVDMAKDLYDEAKGRAKKERDENLRFDAVWCVFDRDDHAHFNQARQTAGDREFELAISNPCFELWLLLHFADSPGMQDRSEIQSRVRQQLPGYDKHVDFKDFEQGYADAVRRARRLDEQAERDGEQHRNPTTGVWRLTESIADNPT